MYRGNGAGGFVTGRAEQIGTGWGPFTALLAPGDWSGDGYPDILARTSEGALLMYRGDGSRRVRRAGPRSARAGSRSPRCWPAATSPATASRTSSPAPRTGGC